MIRKFLLLLLCALPLFAGEVAPQLFIERIEVRNHKRVSPDVVIAESRLREGRTYSETELRDAATRLSRLPFLLSVDFALEKGSERGKHVLVLTVHETKPLFFLVDAVPYFDGGRRVKLDYQDRQGGNDENLALGFRWFVGRRGAVHVGLEGGGTDRPFTREYGALVAGYTQYDIFGTRAFATLNLKRPIEGYGEGRLSPQVVVGAPLSANQTLTLEYDETRFTGDAVSMEGESYERRFGQRVFTTRWSYNTTNDPFFPTEGLVLSVTPRYAWTDETARFIPLPGLPERTASHTRVFGARAGGTRYLEISERDSVWGGLRGEWSRVRERAGGQELAAHDASSATVTMGFAHSLWSREERAQGDSRFEVTALYTNRFELEYGDGYYERNVAQLDAAWIRRTSWGTLRLGVGYAW